MNTNDKRTPDPLEDPRYGVAMAGSLGLFDTAGWPAYGQYAGFDNSGGRRDYGPRGCAGIVLGVAAMLLIALAFAALFLVVA